MIENHVHLLPVKIGDSYYLFDVMRWEIPTHSGTLDGGSVITEVIPFPDEIPEEPVMLMMGGNPNPNLKRKKPKPNKHHDIDAAMRLQ